MELAGSLGDLGTLLPMAIGMMLINGLSPTGMLLAIGLYYVITGVYFKIPVPVQPMKVIGAYAIATAMTAEQVMASGALMGVFLLFIGATNLITVLGIYIEKPVIRGVQLTTGSLLMAQGVRFMLGTSKFQLLRQAAEPYMTVQRVVGIPIGIVIGTIGGILTLWLLENRKFPAGLVVVAGGLVVGLLMGTYEGLGRIEIGLYLPEILPFGIPAGIDFTFALFALALPQLPMTIGNAVIASADLSREYFDRKADRVSYRSLTVSMAIANLFSFCVGGMPLCHGAGGLAAHYRFGARTAGSNLIIGGIFLCLAVFLGSHSLALIYLMPMSVLGVLLLFAGGQLAMTVTDLKERREMFVALMMLGVTLASNLAVGFVVGIVLSFVLKSNRLSV